MTLCDQALDERDHRGDVLGRLWDDVRLEDVELLPVFEELLRVALRDDERVDVLAARAERNLVLAARIGVAVIDQMTRIGDVHDVLGAEPEVLERATDDVRRKVRIQVPDVLVVVHGRPAVVRPELAGPDRLELAQRALGAVVHLDRCAGLGRYERCSFLFEGRDGKRGDRIAAPDDP